MPEFPDPDHAESFANALAAFDTGGGTVPYPQDDTLVKMRRKKNSVCYRILILTLKKKNFKS